MKSIILTCPFTGVEFEALQSNNGRNYIFTNPATGQTFTAKDGMLTLPVSAFVDSPRSVAPIEAAQMLCVSKQRITKLLRTGKLPFFLVNGNKRILESDVLEYQQSRTY